MATKKQIQYMRLSAQGLTAVEIAEVYGVSYRSVHSALARAKKNEIVCPFGDTCFECILDECAIKDGYAWLVNNREREDT